MTACENMMLAAVEKYFLNQSKLHFFETYQVAFSPVGIPLKYPIAVIDIFLDEAYIHLEY